MRASRRLHSSPLLNTGYNLAEKKKMMFARFILWDMSGGRQERKQKCGNLGSAEDEVLCLGVRPRIWGRFFARHHAGHFKLAFRVGREWCWVERGRLRRPGRKGVSSWRCWRGRAKMKTDACVALGGKVSRLHAMWSSGMQGDASVPTLLHTTPAPTRTKTPSQTNSRKTYPRAQSSNIHIHFV